MENKNLLSNLHIDIDSNERIISFKHNFDGKLKEIFDSFNTLYSKFSLHDFLKLKSNGNFITDIALGLSRKKIYEFRQDQQNCIQTENQSPLLCRCLNKTVSDIEQAYHEYKGDKKKLLLETHICGICSHCNVQFNDLYKELEARKSYVNGEPAQVWISKVEKLIEEFYYVCPPEFSNLKFEVLSMNSFNLKIRCIRGESDLKRMEIQKTLENYLLSEIKLDLKLSVVV